MAVFDAMQACEWRNAVSQGGSTAHERTSVRKLVRTGAKAGVAAQRTTRKGSTSAMARSTMNVVIGAGGAPGDRPMPETSCQR